LDTDLLQILVEIWWFGAHCMAFLIDIRDLFTKMTESNETAASSEYCT
jgi:hypothetical protein